jgi:predicted transcriptional regulator
MRKEYILHQTRKLRKARGQARFTATQLSSSSGINKSRLVAIEMGDVTPTKGELNRIRTAIAQKRGVRSF